jgi:acyl-CoA synthetase (AMP-forming)/AMP-acid ligase II/aryl carrier-like protein
MNNLNSLLDVFQLNRELGRAIVYLEGENEAHHVNFTELAQRAQYLGEKLRALGSKPGDKLIIFVNDNAQFIQGFWAAVISGLVPVPIAQGISDEHRHKLLRVATKLGEPFWYTDSKALQRMQTFAAQIGANEQMAALTTRTLLSDTDIASSDLPRVSESSWHTPNIDDPLFIQFSSGSTSEPKGVVLTHRNVLTNAHGATLAAQFNKDDVGLSWMPLTHDMGLVGMHFMMMMGTVHQHFMPTELFIRRPRLWMEFAARIRAGITTSPNFGLSHYLKALGERSVSELDLSNIRLIFNGAEPIARELCDQFVQRLAPAKLKPTAMFPVYGLAEASLAVTFPKLNSLYWSIKLDRHHLNVGSPIKLADATSNDNDVVELVAVGNAIPFCEVKLVDDRDQTVANNCVGHILIKGDNVTRGYFEAEEINKAAITTDGWVRTGDLGLYFKDELFITGRAKDIIFINGQNYYPHDLEAIALQANGLELNKVIAVGIRGTHSATDELTVFALHRGSMMDFIPIANEVSHLINEHTGLEVTRVLPVNRIPKTTSGKLQRHMLIKGFLDGEFDAAVKELESLRTAKMAEQPSAPINSVGQSVADQLLAICNSILEDRQVAMNDNLFDVGVSSLKLVAIHERIEHAFPGMIDLTEIFDHPTVAELSKQLEIKLGKNG